MYAMGVKIVFGSKLGALDGFPDINPWNYKQNK